MTKSGAMVFKIEMQNKLSIIYMMMMFLPAGTR
jgi:hypothetical protein